MFCKYCGSAVDENATFCPKCGKNLRESAPPPSAPYNNQPYNQNNYGNQPGYNQNNQYPRPATKENPLALVGFIFSFFIALVGLICSILGYRKAVNEGAEYKNLALAGIIISAVSMAIAFIWGFCIGFNEALNTTSIIR